MEVSGLSGAAGEWRRQHTLTLDNLARCIDAVEATTQVEHDLGETLRVMAARGGGAAAVRQLALAEEANRRAQAAALAAGRLRRLAAQLTPACPSGDARFPAACRPAAAGAHCPDAQPPA